MFYNVAEAEFEIKRLQDCCQSYRAEIERLRAALREIEDIDLWWADGLDSNVALIKTIARAALAGTDPAIPPREGDGVADILRVLRIIKTKGMMDGDSDDWAAFDRLCTEYRV